MDALSVFEFAAKTVRHISREFRVAWVSGVEAAQRDALVEFEEENEFLEAQSADFDDEALAAGYQQLAADPEYQQMSAARRSCRDGRCCPQTPAASAVVEDLPGCVPPTQPGTDSVDAIKDVLAEHEPRSRGDYVACLGYGYTCAEFADMQDWRDHVAPHIAEALTQAQK